jgi:hypothetical protein
MAVRSGRVGTNEGGVRRRVNPPSILEPGEILQGDDVVDAIPLLG